MARQWNATRWPNSLGWDIASPNGTRYELWPSGSIVQMRIDDSATGYAGQRYCETGVRGICDEHSACSLAQEALDVRQWFRCVDVAELDLT